jgi:hypothetical protein
MELKYDEFIQMLNLRPDVHRVDVVRGDIAGTLSRVEAILGASQ